MGVGMSEIKIEDLRIGQEVWFKGRSCTVRELCGAAHREVAVSGCPAYLKLSDISLTPPKQKKRVADIVIKCQVCTREYKLSEAEISDTHN